jgi:hypothetical protein
MFFFIYVTPILCLYRVIVFFSFSCKVKQFVPRFSINISWMIKKNVIIFVIIRVQLADTVLLLGICKVFVTKIRKYFYDYHLKADKRKKTHTCTQYGIADLQIKNKRDVSPIYMLHSFILLYFTFKCRKISRCK